MIDIHCHLLPAIDDGASDVSIALEMARMAVANGIRKLVLTPHMQPGLYDNDWPGIRSALTVFQQALANADIQLEVRAAAEVRITPEIPQMVSSGLIPMLGTYEGYQVMLLEFPHSHIPPGSDKLVNWLLNHNIRPLIAHPERNKDVIRKFEKIVPLVHSGCLLQLTAGSVAGAFGDACQLRARQMLEAGWVTILASDAHNLNHRIPDLEPGRRAAAEIVGEDASWQLVQDNPWSLVRGLFE